jgi:hypothetical protein
MCRPNLEAFMRWMRGKTVAKKDCLQALVWPDADTERGLEARLVEVEENARG